MSSQVFVRSVEFKNNFEGYKLKNHALSQQGVTLSEMRDGRKVGTQVFTVKSHTDDIPTLFLMGVA